MLTYPRPPPPLLTVSTGVDKGDQKKKLVEEENANQRGLASYQDKINRFRQSLYPKSPATAPLPAKSTAPLAKANSENQRVRDVSESPSHSMANLMKMSNRIVFELSSVFPWDLFPNTICIEESRITFIKRIFFGVSEVHSVDIKDISNIFINTSPFFAEIEVISRTFTENSMKMNKFKKSEAIYARRIIEGLRTLLLEKIDTSQFEISDLKITLERLSITQIVL